MENFSAAGAPHEMEACHKKIQLCPVLRVTPDTEVGSLRSAYSIRLVGGEVNGSFNSESADGDYIL